ncbi:RINT-1 family protein-like protein [Byssothecium circinans]|uniref:RINT-1 family protein-like protein n=1 Tax=Byssothecium circinans TaxID=147558 RepID=A0A6A5TWM6_9PLEO|nr:RINT-1 family protein-like protein [Byssothecium circinans]
MEDVDEMETRVRDYLDDQLQTVGDLDSLDALLANIHTQHRLLQQQLDNAQRDLSGAKQATNDHQASLQDRARAFKAEQADIDRRLRVVTASETSDDAVPRFEAVLDTLQRLDVANAYVELLREVDVLSNEAQSQLQTSNEAALGPYKQLRSLHTQLIRLQDDAEGAAPQLLYHVNQITQALRTKILDAFSADLDKVLKKIRWPNAKATIPSQLQGEWEAAIVKLLDLQMPELEGLAYAHNSGDKIKLPAILFPFDVLAQPLEMRFRYHFEGDKPTNRIDRPEYFLSHIITVLNDYSGFVTDYLQPILLKQLRGTDLALNPVYIDATAAFITALLPMLRSKIGALLPKVANQPQLLSHLMHEVMSFDTTIREEWRYDGGYGLDGWRGLSWEFLVQGDWFGRWLQVEKDFALARYQSITEAPDFGDLDYESVDPKATKPTKGAIRVNDLLETITDRYRPLTSFSQKLRFLIDIQIAIFDKFHERLSSNLEVYLAKTTSLGRAVGGVTKEEQEKLHGVEGLERLCKTYGSADYLEKAMRDWSDDLFFLDIWEELQDRARQANSIGSMTVADVAERTSKAVGADTDGGALFDETAGWYSRLRIRSEKIITDTLNTNVREALRPYRHINPWATLTGPSASASPNLSPTAELDPLLMHLTSTFGFLSRALAPAPLRRIARGVLLTISTTVWDNVLSRHRFSTAGAAQLSADLGAICRVVNKAIGPGVAEAGLRKCLEGSQLVGLPVKGGKSQVKAAPDANDEGGDDWEAWGGDEEAAAPPSPRKESGGDTEVAAGQLGLWEVEKRLFADNQSARDVLDLLGIETLSETEARAVLGRRVELAG